MLRLFKLALGDRHSQTRHGGCLEKAIEGRIGERMAPSLDGESIGIPAYLFLEQAGIDCSIACTVNTAKAFAGWTRLHGIDGRGDGTSGARPGQSLMGASRLPLPAFVGQESVRFLIREPF